MAIYPLNLLGIDSQRLDLACTVDKVDYLRDISISCLCS